MARAHLLASIRVAGYHEDTRAGVRLLVENRISRAVYDAQFNAGRAMRAAGVACHCHACKTQKGAK